MPTAVTDHLEIAYSDTGPPEGAVVLLLHRWSDGPSTWDAMAERLNAADLRTVTPALRCFGEARFRSSSARRTGNSGVLALDAVALGVKRIFAKTAISQHGTVLGDKLPPEAYPPDRRSPMTTTAAPGRSNSDH